MPIATASSLVAYCVIGFSLGHDMLAVGAVLAALVSVAIVGVVVRAHQRARDPARLLLVELAAPLLRHSAWGRQTLAWMLARREIAADRYALAHGARRQDLASALLRLPPLARAHVAGFTPAIDIRLHALLGRQPQNVVSALARRGVPMLVGGLAGATICTWALHALLATVGLVCC